MPRGADDRYWELPRLPSVFKHTLLDRYVPQFGGMTGSRSEARRVVYLDGFAGRGRYDDGSPASPERILRIAQHQGTKGTVAWTCFFVEAEEDSAAELIPVVDEQVRQGVTATAHHGDVLDVLDDVVGAAIALLHAPTDRPSYRIRLCILSAHTTIDGLETPLRLRFNGAPPAATRHEAGGTAGRSSPSLAGHYPPSRFSLLIPTGLSRHGQARAALGPQVTQDQRSAAGNHGQQHRRSTRALAGSGTTWTSLTTTRSVPSCRPSSRPPNHAVVTEDHSCSRAPDASGTSAESTRMA
jgi:hypothetical protein